MVSLLLSSMAALASELNCELGDYGHRASDGTMDLKLQPWSLVGL